MTKIFYYLKFLKKHRRPGVWDPCCNHYLSVNYILKWEAGDLFLTVEFTLYSIIQSDTKKKVINKNRITSKILFRLTQSFSYIRSSLCSRHHQSFRPVLQKIFVSLALKKCAPNELPGAAGAFGSGGQSSRWTSPIPPLASPLLLLWLLPSGQG